MSTRSLTLSASLAVSLIASHAHADAGSCRSRARSLRDAAADCRADVAAGRLSSCSVALEFRGDATVSPAGADALAESFDARAREIDAAGASVTRARDRVDADQSAIRALGFRARSAELEEFGRIPEQVRKRAERETISAIADVALVGLDVSIKQASSLNPWSAQKLIGELKAGGFENKSLFDAIRAVARARGKPAKAKAVHDVIVFVGREKDAVEHGNPEDAEQLANGVTAILAWAVDNPALLGRLAIYKWIAARAYDTAEGVVAVQEVEGLTTLAEGDLSRLKDLDASLHDDVDTLADARRSLAQISDCR